MRLIDADRLLRMEIDATLKPCCMETAHTMAKAFGTAIKAQPTIDAEPIVHAHWVKSEKHEYCSNPNCKHYAKTYDYKHEVELTPYCPYCGAKMDEEV